MNIFSYPYELLVIEDDRSIFQLIEKILHPVFGNKIRLTYAENIEQAIERMENHQVHIALVDLHLGAEYGSDALKACIKMEKGVQLVAMSADHSLLKAIEVFNIGANYFLDKPIEKRSLIDVVERSVAHIDYWHNLVRSRQLRKDKEEAKAV